VTAGGGAGVLLLELLLPGVVTTEVPPPPPPPPLQAAKAKRQTEVARRSALRDVSMRVPHYFFRIMETPQPP